MGPLVIQPSVVICPNGTVDASEPRDKIAPTSAGFPTVVVVANRIETDLSCASRLFIERSPLNFDAHNPIGVRRFVCPFDDVNEAYQLVEILRGLPVGGNGATHNDSQQQYRDDKAHGISIGGFGFHVKGGFGDQSEKSSEFLMEILDGSSNHGIVET